jgi:N-alpha-acetyltransferase 15/16, NatA auxiliary subunit
LGTAISRFTARLLAKLKESHVDDEKNTDWTKQADTTWRWLLSQNADCYEYYKGLLANEGIDLGRFCSLPLSSSNYLSPANITDENRARALKLLRDFFDFKPATAPRRLALDVATGQDFIELIKPYLTNALTKGIPSLFADIKSLYKDPFKRQAIEDIVEEYRSAYASSSPPAGNSVDPTTYLWTLYLLAQHHSYLGRHKQALEILDISVQHTPTLPDLYMVRARALKRAGDPYGAAKVMDAARLLDGQDRFVNTKTGKYLLRAGMPDKAEKIFSLFTKVRAPHDMDMSPRRSFIFGLRRGQLQRQTWRRCRRYTTSLSRVTLTDGSASSTLL